MTPMKIPARIEKDEHGNDTIVVETRVFAGRLTIAGQPFGGLPLDDGLSFEIEIPECPKCEGTGVVALDWSAMTCPICKGTRIAVPTE